MPSTITIICAHHILRHIHTLTQKFLSAVYNRTESVARTSCGHTMRTLRNKSRKKIADHQIKWVKMERKTDGEGY